VTEETNAHAPPLFTVASTSSSRKSWTSRRRRRRKAAPVAAPAPATDSFHSLTTYLQSLKGFTVVVVVLQLLMHPCVFFSSSSSMQDGIDIAITHFPTTGSAILQAAEDRTRLRGPHLDARRQLGES
jgi:hypothetical protein